MVVDVGAEAMLNRRPEGVDLARELGLEVVHPAVQSVTDLDPGPVAPAAALGHGRPGRPGGAARPRECCRPRGWPGSRPSSPGVPLDDDLSVGRPGRQPARRRGGRPAGRAPPRWGVRRSRPPALGPGGGRRSWWRWRAGDRCWPPCSRPRPAGLRRSARGPGGARRRPGRSGGPAHRDHGARAAPHRGRVRGRHRADQRAGARRRGGGRAGHPRRGHGPAARRASRPPRPPSWPRSSPPR